MHSMAKKDEVAETLAFIVEKMATKDDIKIVKDKIDGVNIKVEAVQKTLDAEVMLRTDLKLPRRVHELDEEAFGTGRSKHPKHLPL
jgi:hypothetical protein